MEKNSDREFEEFIESEESACEACGGELKAEKVNLEDYQGGKLYVMEKVEAFVCQECGEIWVPEPAMKEFESMIELAKHKHLPAQKQPKKTTKEKKNEKK